MDKPRDGPIEGFVGTVIGDSNNPEKGGDKVLDSVLEA
jgi:hypothetical protein